MFILTAEMKCKEGKINELLDVAKICVVASRLEENCIGYDCFLSTEHDNTVFFYEKYVDKAAFKSHIKSQHFADFTTAIKDIMAGEIITSKYEAEQK